MSREHRRVDWWTADRIDAGRRVWEAFSCVQDRDMVRRDGILRQMRLYGNMETIGYSPGAAVVSRDGASGSRMGRGMMSLNVIRAVSDTILAQISKQSPRPMFLTDEGNRALRRKAQLLTRFVDGVLYQNRAHMVAPRVAMDGILFGTGLMKIYRSGDRVKMERTFPGEVFVDPAEARDGVHSTLYQRKYIPKDVLIAAYPDAAGAIDQAKTPSMDYVQYHDGEDLGGMVEVVESWKLSSGHPDDDDYEPGKHAIAIQDRILEWGEWNHDRFPFVTFRWSDPILGWWGTGVADELTGIQVEINRLLRKIQRAFHLLAVPWIMVEQGSNVQKAHISGEIGAIIPYKGTPPIVRPNDPVSAQVFGHLNWLYTRAFDHVGVSQVMAGGEHPKGIASGIGVTAAAEVQSGRFAMRIRGYEEMFLEAARWIVELGREIADDTPGFSIVAPRDKYTVQNVPWKDVEMSEDEYILRVFPASSLPMDPAGRLSKVIEMLNSGLVDLVQAKSLLDFPDLASEMALDKAAADATDYIIEKILDDGTPFSPEPFMDLQLFIKRGQAHYLRAMANESAPERHMAVLRNAIEQAEMMTKAAMAEQQNMQAGLGAGSPLPPGPGGAHPAAIQQGDGAL